MKKFFSHPMSWPLVTYLGAIAIAAVVLNPAVLFHPLAVGCIVGPFLLGCRDK